MRPRFSIITRTASRMLFLERALQGLSRTAIPQTEWIICDDAHAGTPGLVEFVEMAGRTSGMGVRLIEPKSANRSRAANAGLAAASGMYVHFHDDDDTVLPGFYARTAQFLEENEQYGGVSVLCNRVDEEVVGNQIIKRRVRPHYHEIRSNNLLSMATTQTIPPIGFVARLDTVRKVGKFDESLMVCEDHDFFLRFLAVSDIGLIADPLAAFHQRTSSRRNSFANSLASTDHETQDSLFRTEMLRRDLQSGSLGTGWLLALGEMNRSAWRRKVLARRIGRFLPQFIRQRL